MANLASVNGMSLDDAIRAFRVCCGSTRWAEGMAARRPFGDEDALLAAAGAIEKSMTRADWLEAFAAHPKIGDLDSLKKKFAAIADLSSSEQASVAVASHDTLAALAEGNRVYEQTFGHIFIVCAAGKSADEMLALLRQRLANPPDDELRIAAAEQTRITRLRLQRIGQ